MLWSVRDDLVDRVVRSRRIVIFSIGGALFGLCWYLAMRFIFATCAARRAMTRRAVEVMRPRGKFYRWTVWAGLMAADGHHHGRACSIS